MKRVLSVFLTVAMLLCLPVTTFASEVEESQPSACTVHTLDELKAALAAAADGDSIAIADCIEISDETVSSDKAVKIVQWLYWRYVRSWQSRRLVWLDDRGYDR